MSERINDLTAVILAGGRSTRMKKDKALLDWKGRPLIQHVVESLRPLANEVLIVAKERGKFFFLDVEVGTDLFSASSPLVGIYSGLTHSRTELNFILACDMPFVGPGVVRRLYDAIKDFDTVLPESVFGIEPLCGIYRKRCADILEAHIRRDSLTLKRVLRDLKVKVIPLEEWSEAERLSFSNINTPLEYTEAKRPVDSDGVQ